MEVSTEKQLTLFPSEFSPDSREHLSTTFLDNMKLPIHRWYRYSAGFSAEWVKSVLRDHAKKDSLLLDPFAGSGTTMVAANEWNIPSIGYEKHFFIRRIAEIKLNHRVDFNRLKKLYHSLVSHAAGDDFDFDFDLQPELLRKCYTPETLKILSELKSAYHKTADGTVESEILWLAITAILRPTSHAGTAQWQYVLPQKSKKNVLPPLDALAMKFQEFVRDIRDFESREIQPLGRILNFDARQVHSDFRSCFDLLITSPPYPNNYDYADATRLEMTFWEDISGWSDLQEKIRHYLIRSCSQHTAAERITLDAILSEAAVNPIRDELTDVCKTLEKVRLEHGGKKTYHTMIAAYYSDMAKVFLSLRSAMKPNSLVCFVIGDSAPYGVYAPADEWLGRLAMAAGFTSWTFEKTRDRNTKWKNRKHTVPLKEGRLWIEG